MRILMVGDVVANSGVSFLRQHLNRIKYEEKIDFCIVNGENSSPIGKGITRTSAEYLYACGADVITLGNHAFNHPDVYDLFDDYNNIIRPINYPAETAGEGYVIYTTHTGYDVCVINANGRVFMDNFDCPFRKIEKLLRVLPSDLKTIIIDFHAETTSEKAALAHYFDGKVTAVLGTHTHVQTADEQILTNGTGFITDVGMTGVKDSIIGVKKEIIIDKFYSLLPKKFEVAEGKVFMNGVVMETDDTTGKVITIKRINL